MKKIYIFITLILIMLHIEVKAISGYFITNNNDTVRAKFIIQMNKKSVWWFSTGFQYDTINHIHKHKHPKLTADIAKTVVINYKETTHVLVSKNYSGPFVDKPQKIFVEVNIDTGFLFLGSVYVGKYNRYVLQKSGDSLFIMNRTGFPKIDKKEILLYFSDCPEIADDINRYLYTSNDSPDDPIPLLVKKYNQACGSKMKLLKQ
jgi:hypothetical protein